METGVLELPYTDSEEKNHRASVIPVQFTLEGLSQSEIETLSHLSSASNGIAPIFALQHNAEGLRLFAALLDLEKRTTNSEVRESLKVYNTLFAGRSSVWNSSNDLALRFPLEKNQIPLANPLHEFYDMLTNVPHAPPGRAFYPEGITEGEISGLEDALRVNSSVLRNADGSHRVELHERRYAKELVPVINALMRAETTATSEDLKTYIRAKIKELRQGALEDRAASDKAWLAISGSIDFVLGTGIETYLDRIKGVRGYAQAVVCRVNNTYQGFSDAFAAMLPELEAKAPWKHKKELDSSNIPRLRFVDALTWAGGYDLFPATVLAESLPNEKKFCEQYGSVNLVFANVQEAIARSSEGRLMQKEFLLRDTQAGYGPEIPYISLLMTAAHEIGHASGGLAIEHEPSVLFGADYSIMEEARAELFSMWALPILVDTGVLTQEQEVTGYYAMTLSLARAMKQPAVDHYGSRNMMFNYFLKRDALLEIEEDGKAKLAVNRLWMRVAVKEMLAKLADIRATGDIGALARFKEEYISSDRRPGSRRECNICQKAGFSYSQR